MDKGMEKEALLMAFAEVPEESAPSGYEIISELGRGGMAVIYHALQLKPEREVALKVMLPKYAEDEVMRKRFQLEVKAMAVLENTNILPIYEVGEWNGIPFFSMKLAERGSLASVLTSMKPEVKQVVKWISDVAEAIHYAHQRGVLHRDLKPDNLLFDEEGQIYVGDFGVAKTTFDQVETGLTVTEAMIGTPHYMAPEIVSGDVPIASVAGDVYSLGAVFYECLIGQRPYFEITNMASLLRTIVDKSVPRVRSINPNLPLDIEVICQKAMAKNPEDRYSSMRSFYNDLVLWESDKPIKARKLSSYESVFRWCKARPFITVLLMALCCMAIAWAVTISRASYSRGLALHEANLALAVAERSAGKPGSRQRAIELLKKSADFSQSGAINNELIAILSEGDLVEDEIYQGDRMNSGTNLSGARTDQKYSLNYISESEVLDLSKVSNSQNIRRWNRGKNQTLKGEFINDSILFISGSERGDFLYTGENFTQEIQLSLKGKPLYISSDRLGHKVAFAQNEGISILDVRQKKMIQFLNVGVSRCKPEWSQDGSLLAVSHGDLKGVYLYETVNWNLYQIYRTKGFPLQMSFQPNGRLFAVFSDDMKLNLMNLRTHSVFVRLAVTQKNISSMEFSSNGRHLLIDGDIPKSWSVIPPEAFKQWSGWQLSYGLVRSFTASLSPKERFFLTVNSEGVHLWDISKRQLSDFYSVENQRIDSRTDAWWLSSSTILIQVPGGLEIVNVAENGKLSLNRIVKERPPGSRVIDIREGNQWLVELRNQDNKRRLALFSNGDFTQEKVYAGELNLEKGGAVQIDENGNSAELLENGMIKISGDYSFLLPPPKGAVIQQITWMSSQKQLLGVSFDGNVYEWDLEHLQDKVLEFESSL